MMALFLGCMAFCQALDLWFKLQDRRITHTIRQINVPDPDRWIAEMEKAIKERKNV